MNILFFIYSLSAGGAERVTATLANYWAGKAWQVSIVTIAGLERDFYKLDPSIDRIALGLDRNSANVLAALSNNARRLIALRNVLKRVRPDVAVSMMATANVLLVLAGQDVGIPMIGSERIHPPTLPLGRVWNAIRRLSYPKLSALVAQTEQSAAWLREHAPAPHIAVIPNPVKYPMTTQGQCTSPGSVREKTDAQYMLLAVGRLAEQKGFDRLLQAYGKVSANHPEWVLVILGEGPQRAELEQQAVELGVVTKVHMPGAVGNVGEWFDVADLYVLTSRFEGFPNTLLEALAYGLPSVAVDCETGPRDILRHEVDGLLVPQDDQHALINALDRLMGDDELRRCLGEHAVEARERFSVEKVAGMWEDLFEKAGVIDEELC